MESMSRRQVNNYEQAKGLAAGCSMPRLLLMARAKQTNRWAVFFSGGAIGLQMFFMPFL